MIMIIIIIKIIINQRYGPDKMLGRKKAKKRKINNEANWMVSNSAQLDRRTKQQTQFGVSASNGSRDMGRTKSRRNKKKKKKKKKKEKKRKMNIDKTI